jgi:CoA:oxalate CoA-transferase
VEHWLERLEAAGIPCGPINDVAAVLGDPQVEARNMIVTSEDPKAGTLTLAGNPVKLSGVEDPPTRPAAPALDADRQALLDELGLA